MWEYIGSWNDPNYMAHSGVKGQKWGVRRYQNLDGSLTPEGRRHYALLGGGTALGAGLGAGAYRHRKEIGAAAKKTYQHTLGAASRAFANRDPATAFGRIGGLYDKAAGRVGAAYGKVSGQVGASAKRGYEHTLGAASRAFANRDPATAFGRIGGVYDKAAGRAGTAYGKVSGQVGSAYKKASGAVNKAYEGTLGPTVRAARNRDVGTAAGRVTEGIASTYRNAANYVRGGAQDLRTLGNAVRTGQAGTALQYLKNSTRAKVALGTAAGLGAAGLGAAGYGIYRAVKKKKSNQNKSKKRR